MILAHTLAPCSLTVVLPVGTVFYSLQSIFPTAISFEPYHNLVLEGFSQLRQPRLKEVKRPAPGRRTAKCQGALSPFPFLPDFGLSLPSSLPPIPPPLGTYPPSQITKYPRLSLEVLNRRGDPTQAQSPTSRRRAAACSARGSPRAWRMAARRSRELC